MRGGASAQKRSPNGKFGGVGASGGEGAQWRRMSLPAMLLGETVLEIVQASQFARDIVTAAGATNREPPRTPKPTPRTRKPAAEQTPLRARRAREKQSHRGGAATRFADAATPPSRGRVRSRIQFKPASPVAVAVAVGRPSVSANRVSPKNRPWAKKAVMFPNPAFHASTSAAANTDACATPSPSKKQKRFYKTRSPVVALARQTPHKFLVKSPPSALGSKLRNHGKAVLPARPAAAVSPPPPVKAQASSAKTRRCSFSPSRLATRLVSPIKARLSLNRSRDRDSGVGVGGGGPMSGLKQRPGVSLTVRTVSSKISSR
jgi:microtubule-binding protein TANGLED1